MFKHLSITDIFFDLDHTLWDFEKNSALAFYKVFETHRLHIDLPLFLQIYEPINLQYWKLYRDEQVTKQELRRGRLNDAFAKYCKFEKIENEILECFFNLKKFKIDIYEGLKNVCMVENCNLNRNIYVVN